MNEPALIPYLGTWLMPKPPQDPNIQARGVQVWQGIVTAIGSVLVGIGGANFGGGGNDQDAQIAQLQQQLKAQEEAQAAQKKLVVILIALLFGVPLIGAGIYFATR